MRLYHQPGPVEQGSVSSAQSPRAGIARNVGPMEMPVPMAMELMGKKVMSAVGGHGRVVVPRPKPMEVQA